MLQARPTGFVAPACNTMSGLLAIAEAQHVIMMEPIFDPAVEQQAIGRIHRIGQASPF